MRAFYRIINLLANIAYAMLSFVLTRAFTGVWRLWLITLPGLEQIDSKE